MMEMNTLTYHIVTAECVHTVDTINLTFTFEEESPSVTILLVFFYVVLRQIVSLSISHLRDNQPF